MRARDIGTVRRLVAGAFHLANERLRGVLHVTDEQANLTRDLRQLFGAKKHEGGGAKQRHIGNGEHPEGFFPAPGNGTCPAPRGAG